MCIHFGVANHTGLMEIGAGREPQPRLDYVGFLPPVIGGTTPKSPWLVHCPHPLRHPRINRCHLSMWKVPILTCSGRKKRLLCLNSKHKIPLPAVSLVGATPLILSVCSWNCSSHSQILSSTFTSLLFHFLDVDKIDSLIIFPSLESPMRTRCHKIHVPTCYRPNGVALSDLSHER